MGEYTSLGILLVYEGYDANHSWRRVWDPWTLYFSKILLVWYSFFAVDRAGGDFFIPLSASTSYSSRATPTSSVAHVLEGHAA